MSVTGNTELSVGFRFYGIVCDSIVKDEKVIPLGYDDTLSIIKEEVGLKIDGEIEANCSGTL